MIDLKKNRRQELAQINPRGSEISSQMPIIRRRSLAVVDPSAGSDFSISPSIECQLMFTSAAQSPVVADAIIVAEPRRRRNVLEKLE